MKPVSSKQYAARGGCSCPACGSQDVEGFSIEVDHGGAYQECHCHDCDARWNDQYRLKGYSALRVPEKKP